MGICSVLMSGMSLDTESRISMESPPQSSLEQMKRISRGTFNLSARIVFLTSAWLTSLKSCVSIEATRPTGPRKFQRRGIGMGNGAVTTMANGVEKDTNPGCPNRKEQSVGTAGLTVPCSSGQASEMSIVLVETPDDLPPLVKRWRSLDFPDG